MIWSFQYLPTHPGGTDIQSSGINPPVIWWGNIYHSVHGRFVIDYDLLANQPFYGGVWGYEQDGYISWGVVGGDALKTNVNVAKILWAGNLPAGIDKDRIYVVDGLNWFSWGFFLTHPEDEGAVGFHTLQGTLQMPETFRGIDSCIQNEDPNRVTFFFPQGDAFFEDINSYFYTGNPDDPKICCPALVREDWWHRLRLYIRFFDTVYILQPSDYARKCFYRLIEDELPTLLRLPQPKEWLQRIPITDIMRGDWKAIAELRGAVASFSAGVGYTFSVVPPAMQNPNADWFRRVPIEDIFGSNPPPFIARYRSLLSKIPGTEVTYTWKAWCDSPSPSAIYRGEITNIDEGGFGLIGNQPPADWQGYLDAIEAGDYYNNLFTIGPQGGIFMSGPPLLLMWDGTSGDYIIFDTFTEASNNYVEREVQHYNKGYKTSPGGVKYYSAYGAYAQASILEKYATNINDIGVYAPPNEDVLNRALYPYFRVEKSFILGSKKRKLLVKPKGFIWTMVSPPDFDNLTDLINTAATEVNSVSHFTHPQAGDLGPIYCSNVFVWWRGTGDPPIHPNDFTDNMSGAFVEETAGDENRKFFLNALAPLLNTAYRRAWLKTRLHAARDTLWSGPSKAYLSAWKSMDISTSSPSSLPWTMLTGGNIISLKDKTIKVGFLTASETPPLDDLKDYEAAKRAVWRVLSNIPYPIVDGFNPYPRRFYSYNTVYKSPFADPDNMTQQEINQIILSYNPKMLSLGAFSPIPYSAITRDPNPDKPFPATQRLPNKVFFAGGCIDPPELQSVGRYWVYSAVIPLDFLSFSFPITEGQFNNTIDTIFDTEEKREKFRRMAHLINSVHWVMNNFPNSWDDFDVILPYLDFIHLPFVESARTAVEWYVDNSNVRYIVLGTYFQPLLVADIENPSPERSYGVGEKTVAVENIILQRSHFASEQSLSSLPQSNKTAIVQVARNLINATFGFLSNVPDEINYIPDSTQSTGGIYINKPVIVPDGANFVAEERSASSLGLAERNIRDIYKTSFTDKFGEDFRQSLISQMEFDPNKLVDVNIWEHVPSYFWRRNDPTNTVHTWVEKPLIEVASIIPIKGQWVDKDFLKDKPLMSHFSFGALIPMALSEVGYLHWGEKYWTGKNMPIRATSDGKYCYSGTSFAWYSQGDKLWSSFIGVSGTGEQVTQHIRVRDGRVDMFLSDPLKIHNPVALLNLWINDNLISIAGRNLIWDFGRNQTTGQIFDLTEKKIRYSDNDILRRYEQRLHGYADWLGVDIFQTPMVDILGKFILRGKKTEASAQSPYIHTGFPISVSWSSSEKGKYPTVGVVWKVLAGEETGEIFTVEFGIPPLLTDFYGPRISGIKYDFGTQIWKNWWTDINGSFVPWDIFTFVTPPLGWLGCTNAPNVSPSGVHTLIDDDKLLIRDPEGREWQYGLAEIPPSSVVIRHPAYPIGLTTPLNTVAYFLLLPAGSIFRPDFKLYDDDYALISVGGSDFLSLRYTDNVVYLRMRTYADYGGYLEHSRMRIKMTETEEVAAPHVVVLAAYMSDNPPSIYHRLDAGKVRYYLLPLSPVLWSGIPSTWRFANGEMPFHCDLIPTGYGGMEYVLSVNNHFSYKDIKDEVLDLLNKLEAVGETDKEIEEVFKEYRMNNPKKALIELMNGLRRWFWDVNGGFGQQPEEIEDMPWKDIFAVLKYLFMILPENLSLCRPWYSPFAAYYVTDDALKPFVRESQDITASWHTYNIFDRPIKGQVEPFGILSKKCPFVFPDWFASSDAKKERKAKGTGSRIRDRNDLLNGAAHRLPVAILCRRHSSINIRTYYNDATKQHFYLSSVRLNPILPIQSPHQIYSIWGLLEQVFFPNISPHWWRIANFGVPLSFSNLNFLVWLTQDYPAGLMNTVFNPPFIPTPIDYLTRILPRNPERFRYRNKPNMFPSSNPQTGWAATVDELLYYDLQDAMADFELPMDIRFSDTVFPQQTIGIRTWGGYGDLHSSVLPLSPAVFHSSFNRGWMEYRNFISPSKTFLLTDETNLYGEKTLGEGKGEMEPAHILTSASYVAGFSFVAPLPLLWQAKGMDVFPLFSPVMSLGDYFKRRIDVLLPNRFYWVAVNRESEGFIGLVGHAPIRRMKRHWIALPIFPYTNIPLLVHSDSIEVSKRWDILRQIWGLHVVDILFLRDNIALIASGEGKLPLLAWRNTTLHKELQEVLSSSVGETYSSYVWVASKATNYMLTLGHFDRIYYRSKYRKGIYNIFSDPLWETKIIGLMGLAASYFKRPKKVKPILDMMKIAGRIPSNGDTLALALPAFFLSAPTWAFPLFPAFPTIDIESYFSSVWDKAKKDIPTFNQFALGKPEAATYSIDKELQALFAGQAPVSDEWLNEASDTFASALVKILFDENILSWGE